ncbi:DUF488 family protein [Leptospira langatensis]|uniref:DUF488 family protein n=1 Tax=Leptospira langatensis TaxID=2484983 RepID=A0A5R2ASY4_9LEPT|nr:DUF488 family protein [Leptospira langatensis]TGJ99823.1 DUF488 family protein [Leptospira langatensis]
MQIYTSYHHKTDILLENGIVVFNISRFAPRWIAKGKQLHFLSLAPTEEMVKAGYEWEQFEDQILKPLNPAEVVARLRIMANLLSGSRATAIALCCYEKDPDKCHRRRVAWWLTNAGYPTFEYYEQSSEGPVLFPLSSS